MSVEQKTFNKLLDVHLNFEDYVVKTCPKCQGYLQRFKVDGLSVALGLLGKFHCLSCDYVEGLIE